MREQNFFRCNHCGNLVSVITNSGVPMFCCGEAMTELLPNTVEAATEKHIPEVSVNGRLVHAKIGSVPHPMTEEHHIEFIYLQTENGGQMKRLTVGSQAQTMFAVMEDKPLEVYAYCNLHGLWKVTIPCSCGCGCGCEDNAKEPDTAEEPDPADESICSAEFSAGCI